MPYALCPMPYALCPMPYALCPMPYARRNMLRSKGYTYLLNNKKGNRRYIFPPISPFEKDGRPDCEPGN
jgi:hypothetical protein